MSKWTSKMAHISSHSPEMGDVPLAHTVALTEELPRLQPETRPSKAGVLIRVSEFLSQVFIPPAIGGTTTTVPLGGSLHTHPLNPLMLDGTVLARQCSVYDQFRVLRWCVEYIPLCPMTQAGGVVGSCSNDSYENLTLEGGELAVRQALRRPGSQVSSVNANSVFNLNFPQLKWYQTHSFGDPSLYIPGVFDLLSATNQSNATASPVQLGFLWLHYELEVRSDSLELPAGSSLVAATGSLPFDTIDETKFDTVTNAWAGSSLPAGFSDPGTIGWCSVASVSDGVSTSAWRTWYRGGSDQLVLIEPGFTLYFRVTDDSQYIEYYPSLAAAIMGRGNDGGAAGDNEHPYNWLFSRTFAATGTKGFKIYNISGASLTSLL